MKSGDRVLRRRDGAIGTVLEVFERELVVDVDGMRRTWDRWSVRPVSVSRSPRGVSKASDQMRAAARQAAEGTSRAEIARLYGVTKGTIDGWIEKVREADQDARNLHAVGR